ncbi:MCE family protein [Mycobacterium sp. 1274756.6]|uniref:MCE family protein n=1 Tax=Mycobacterium sp. 1274756.6 TaxID=1834076 RepID=UPI0008010D40|nr:MCE family protein [Mycobacterium sp. 1274756.6]OBJ69438.1 mammalian cell entry protein [Mycobacterium sp. 1274756.6]
MSGRLRIALAVATIVVATVAVTAAAVLPRLLNRHITVTAHFEDVVGLYEGNGVSVLGMQVGKVTRIHNEGGHVAVTLSIDRDVAIPADAQAVTVSSSILTDRHVELTPPYRGGATLKDGDVLGLGRTRTPVEFGRTLSMVDKLGKALHGDDNGQGPLGDLVSLGSAITADNSAAIKTTLDKLSQALRVGDDKGARSKESIQAIITSVADLTQAAADNDAEIREFSSNLRQLSDILAAEDLGSGTTGAKLNQILDQATRLLDDHREELTTTFAQTHAITTTLTDNQRELAELLDVAPLTVDNIYRIIDPVAGSLRAHALVDKIVFNGQFAKEMCNLMGLKQLGCATGTLQDYGPDFGLTQMLDLMANGISGTP